VPGFNLDKGYVQKMTRTLNRRTFLKQSASTALAAVGVPQIVDSSALGKAGRVAPGNRIVLGLIGLGIQGTGHLRGFLHNDNVHVAAVCDLWPMQRQRAKELVDKTYGNNDCTAYKDFRDLCARQDIDACLIATCDNWHVLTALEAVRNGKDVYLEKAMGVKLAEDKALREAVHSNKAVFQFGTQQRSSREFRFACELVRNGRIGKLHTIFVGSPTSRTFPNQPTQPVPADFDYDMWLGPAPWAPYTWHRCRPYTKQDGWALWYHISDYALGHISGWGIHHVDIAQWGNDADDTGPVEIQGTGEFPRDGLADCATRWDVEQKYANGVTLIYMDAYTARSRSPQFRAGHGVLFVGTDGWVFVSRGRLETHPKSLLRSVIGPDEIRLPRSGDHHRNFLDCIRSRERTICPVDSAVRSDTICHQADIAIRLARKLRWDPVKEQFINDDEANHYLTRPMRSPWRL